MFLVNRCTNKFTVAVAPARRVRFRMRSNRGSFTLAHHATSSVS